jgi:hypothetical protein
MIILIYIFLIARAQESDVELIESYESIIKTISTKAEELFERRCQLKSECLNMDCTYEGCSDIMPNMVCVPDKYFSTLTRCDSCYNKGMQLTFDKSIIFYNDAISNMKVNEKEILCVFSGLDDTFKSLWKENGEKLLKWQYLGTFTGVHRSFPGKAWREDLCLKKSYDCRTRPWYDHKFKTNIFNIS